MRYTKDRTDVRQQVTTPQAGAALLAATLWGPSLAPPAWHTHAACADTDIGAWFERSNRPDIARQLAELCRSCPVAAECAADAQQWESAADPIRRYGYRAGQTPTTRQTQAHRHPTADNQTATRIA